MKERNIIETKDHFFLAKTLAASMKLNRVEGIAFIIGNVFPDINPLSYFIPSGNNSLGGHNYSTRKEFIQSIGAIGKIQGFWGWFITGEKFHYLADAFTRPHNHEFECSSKAHVAYERRLHKYFTAKLPPIFNLLTVSSPDNFSAWIEYTHHKYIQKNPGIFKDCSYILNVCKKACAFIVLHK